MREGFLGFIVAKVRGQQAKNALEERSYQEFGLRSQTPIEGELERREIESNRYLGGGCNKSNIIKLKDDGLGVFKPASGERPDIRDNAKAGTYCLRERAAYLVDQALGFGLVPPTVLREVDGEIGSFQQFIPNAVTANEIGDLTPLIKEGYLRSEMVKLWIFDYIVRNSDRGGSNFLLNPEEGKVYAIDNGLCFAPDRHDYFKQFYDERIPPSVTEGIDRFLSDGAIRETCRQSLETLLGKEETDAFIGRVERVRSLVNKKGVIPIEHYEKMAGFE